MKTYKGFDKNLMCRGFQFEEGKEYQHYGKVECCKSGFHSCENPLDLFNYYTPSDSVYREVEIDGDTDKGDNEDSKIASSKIKIGASINFKTIVDLAIKFVFEKCYWTKENKTGDHGAASQTGDQGAASQTGDHGAASQTGNYGAASQTGDQGAASQTGYRGAASQTGNYGAASQTGYQGAASQTGYRGAASQTGDQGAASQTGNYGAAISLGIDSSSQIINTDEIKSSNSTAIALGRDSKARAPKGCWIVLAEHKKTGGIKAIKTAFVDGVKIKENVWYNLKNGNFVKAKE